MGEEVFNLIAVVIDVDDVLNNVDSVVVVVVPSAIPVLLWSLPTVSSVEAVVPSAIPVLLWSLPTVSSVEAVVPSAIPVLLWSSPISSFIDVVFTIIPSIYIIFSADKIVFIPFENNDKFITLARHFIGIAIYLTDIYCYYNVDQA